MAAAPDIPEGECQRRGRVPPAAPPSPARSKVWQETRRRAGGTRGRPGLRRNLSEHQRKLLSPTPRRRTQGGCSLRTEPQGACRQPRAGPAAAAGPGNWERRGRGRRQRTRELQARAPAAPRKAEHLKTGPHSLPPRPAPPPQPNPHTWLTLGPRQRGRGSYAGAARMSVQRDPAPPPTPAGASGQPRLRRDFPGSRSRLGARGTCGKAPTAARGGPGIASTPAGSRRGRASCAAGAASPSAPQPSRPTLRRQHPPRSPRAGPSGLRFFTSKPYQAWL